MYSWGMYIQYTYNQYACCCISQLHLTMTCEVIAQLGSPPSSQCMMHFCTTKTGSFAFLCCFACLYLLHTVHTYCQFNKYTVLYFNLLCTPCSYEPYDGVMKMICTNYRGYLWHPLTLRTSMTYICIYVHAVEHICGEQCIQLYD